MDFADIEKNLKDNENMGGLTNVIFCKHSDVETWPTRAVAPADATADAAWVGDLVLKSTKKGYRMYVTEDTCGIDDSMVGELDAQSYEATLSLFTPGMRADKLGLLNNVKNEDLVFLVKNEEGEWYMLGDENHPCKLSSATGSTGKATTDRKGVSLEFKYKNNGLRMYVGDTTSILVPAV